MNWIEKSNTGKGKQLCFGYKLNRLTHHELLPFHSLTYSTTHWDSRDTQSGKGKLQAGVDVKQEREKWGNGDKLKYYMSSVYEESERRLKHPLLPDFAISERVQNICYALPDEPVFIKLWAMTFYILDET